MRLGSALAMPLTGNRQLKVDLLAEYKSELREAVAADGSQGSAEVVKSSWIKRARR